MSLDNKLNSFCNNYKNSKIITGFILFVLINLIIVTSNYNNFKVLGFYTSSLTLKTAFAVMNTNNNIFVNTSNLKSIDNLVKKDKQLLDNGFYKDAIKLADYILSLENNNTNALNNKGLALDNLGNFTGAIALYDKVLAIDPNNTNALNNKGVALKNMGNFTGAIQYSDGHRP